jgi:hypothetical protein
MHCGTCNQRSANEVAGLWMAFQNAAAFEQGIRPQYGGNAKAVLAAGLAHGSKPFAGADQAIFDSGGKLIGKLSVAWDFRHKDACGSNQAHCRLDCW